MGGRVVHLGDALLSVAARYPYGAGLVAVAVGLLLLLRGVRAVQWASGILFATTVVVLAFLLLPPVETAVRWGLVGVAGLLAAVLGLLAPSLWLAVEAGLVCGAVLAFTGLSLGSLPGAAVLGAFGFALGCPVGWRMTFSFWRAVCVGFGTSALWFGWMSLAGLPESPWVQAALAGASVLFGAWAFRFQPGREGDPSSSRDAETREVVKLARRALETSRN